MTTDLIPSVNLDRVLAQRDAIVAQIHAAAEAMREAEQIWATTPFGFNGIAERPQQFSLDIMLHDTVRMSDANAEAAIKRVDAAGWQYLIDASGMVSLMDSATFNDWMRDILNGNAPALTRENVLSTFEKLRADRGTMFAQGVVDTFRRIGRNRWSYAANGPFRFGEKIVLEGFLKYDGLMAQPCHADDLSRIAHVLDGRPAPDHRSGISSKAGRAMQEHPETSRAWVVEDDHLLVKFFKNGNAHIVFKRGDVLAQINQILAHACGEVLPDGVAAQRKRRTAR